MFVNYKNVLLKIFPILLILLTSCTGPYSVPKKGENDKNTRVIFEEGIETTVQWNLDNMDWIKSILKRYYEFRIKQRFLE